jgi:hypothetical protein
MNSLFSPTRYAAILLHITVLLRGRYSHFSLYSCSFVGVSALSISLYPSHTFLSLKMDTAGSTKTSVVLYETTLCHILEDSDFHILSWFNANRIDSPFVDTDRLCGLVVRVPGYRFRGPGFDSWHYQIF